VYSPGYPPFPVLFLSLSHSQIPSLILTPYSLITSCRLGTGHGCLCWVVVEGRASEQAADANRSRSDFSDFNSAYFREPHSTFHKMHIMLKIFIYTLSVTKNISTFLNRPIQIRESRYVIILFQSCKISFYI